MVTTVTDNSPQSINTSLFSLDKEVQEIKKVTDTFNDTLSGINTESGVISVNGKQGIVELTASDVDALPSSTIIPTTTSELENTSGFITINDVGSSFVPITRKVNNKQLNTDITLTASDVGALPDTTVIPTKTSQLTNDNGFITSSDSITGNAATATTAETAINANLSKTLDTVNGDKLQIGNGTTQNVTNAKHAATADAFSTTYISNITPAQAAAMTGGSTIWPLSYDKNYLQTVSVTWDDYSSHTFPAGAAGMFFPGYSSNGGTLILINYGSNRMLYNVWIDSNRWSGWHYIDMPDISYT